MNSRLRLSALLLLLITAVALAMLFLGDFPPPLVRRALHVLFFGAWVWSLARLLRAAKRSDAVVFAIAVGFVAAAAGELIQHWIPPHMVEWSGFLASAAGVLCGGVLARKRSDGAAAH